MGGFRLKTNIRTTDIVTIAYLFVTAIYIMIFEGFSDFTLLAMGWRIIIILVGIVTVFMEYKYDNPWTRFFHLFYPILFISYLYGETASINNYLFSEDLDPVIYKWEHWLFGFQPSIEFSKQYYQLWLSEALNFGYFSLYLMTFAVCFVFFKYKPETVERVIFIVLSSYLLYYLIFIIVPVVGPQYYFEYPLNQSLDSGVFSSAVKLVQKYGEEPTGAFPSSHVGLVLIFLYLSYKDISWLFWTILPLFILIVLATVYIKAHYGIDVIAGLLSAPIIYFVSTKLYKITISRFSYLLR